MTIIHNSIIITKNVCGSLLSHPYKHLIMKSVFLLRYVHEPITLKLTSTKFSDRVPWWKIYASFVRCF